MLSFSQSPILVFQYTLTADKQVRLSGLLIPSFLQECERPLEEVLGVC